MKLYMPILLSALFLIPFWGFSQNELKDSDIHALLFIAQEEKVAEDFYMEMFLKHGLNCFRSMSKSERLHKEQVELLIDHFTIENPVRGKFEAAGKFRDEAFEEFYSDLLREGSRSVTDAFVQSARFEETDISDLTKFMNQSENEYIVSTFSKLKDASENHLRAIVNCLKKRGVDYKPKVLTPEAFRAIMNSKGA